MLPHGDLISPLLTPGYAKYRGHRLDLLMLYRSSRSPLRSYPDEPTQSRDCTKRDENRDRV